MCGENHLVFFGKTEENFTCHLLKLRMQIYFRVFHHNNTREGIILFHVRFQKGEGIDTAYALAEQIDWADSTIADFIPDNSIDVQKAL